MVKNLYLITAGERCHLSCEYCIEADRVGGFKKEAIDIMNKIKIFDNDEFAFVGGEPLGDINFLIEICNTIIRKNKKAKIRIHTSGLFFSEEFKVYKESEEQIKLYLSADFINEKYRKRKYKSGKLIFNDVINVIKKIENIENYYDGICITYNKENLNDIDNTIDFYSSLGIKNNVICASENYETYDMELFQTRNKVVEFSSITAVRINFNEKLSRKTCIGVTDCNNLSNNSVKKYIDSNYTFYINEKIINEKFIVSNNIYKNTVEILIDEKYLFFSKEKNLDIIIKYKNKTFYNKKMRVEKYGETRDGRIIISGS